VIDVNGWSFVKGNESYYDRVAMFLKETALLNVKREVDYVNTQPWGLTGYMSVLRHADRTPKQKWKGKFKSQIFKSLLNGGNDELALRKPEQLESLLQTAYKARDEGKEDASSLDYLINILELKRDKEGTKVQLRPSFKDSEDGKGTVLSSVQLIIKWGGLFTSCGGLKQSKDLGNDVRKELIKANGDLLKVFYHLIYE
jgi:inositol hexakisphosphate/diphosphoinositol-pentakisphosphate kinase